MLDLKAVRNSPLVFLLCLFLTVQVAESAEKSVSGLWADREEDCGTPFRLWVEQSGMSSEGFRCEFLNGNFKNKSSWVVNAKCFDPSVDEEGSSTGSQQVDLSVNGGVLTIYYHADDETNNFAVKCEN